MTTSGHFADTHGLTGYERNLTNRQFVVAWADTQNSYGSHAGYGQISRILPWRSTRNLTEEANVRISRNILAEQHVCWQEQGRQSLNFQQAGFESAAQEYEQAARYEVHVVVALTTEMSRAEMRERMGALESKAEQTWTSHQVVLLNEMNNSVAGDALVNRRRTCARISAASLAPLVRW